MKVLIVDDDEVIVEFIHKVLTSSQHLFDNKFDITTATTVDGALEHFKQHDFEILISDVHMPDPHKGINFLSYVRKTYDTTIIIVTGYDSDSDFSLGSENIFRLSKPFHVNDFLVMIKQALSTRVILTTLKQLNHSMDTNHKNIKTILDVIDGDE